MKYPVNYTYDRRDGSSHFGMAATAEEAVALCADWDDDVRPDHAELNTRECGSTCRTQAEFERHWAAEIAAGWVSVIHVYGGFKGEATYWRLARRATG